MNGIPESRFSEKSLVLTKYEILVVKIQKQAEFV
jgi:hypothetical protein